MRVTCTVQVYLKRSNGFPTLSRARMEAILRILERHLVSSEPVFITKTDNPEIATIYGVGGMRLGFVTNWRIDGPTLSIIRLLRERRRVWIASEAGLSAVECISMSLAEVQF